MGGEEVGVAVVVVGEAVAEVGVEGAAHHPGRYWVPRPYRWTLEGMTCPRPPTLVLAHRLYLTSFY